MKKSFWNIGLCLALTGVMAWAPVYADSDAIMDVDDNAANFTGTWGTSTNKLLYYGDDYQYAWGAGGSNPTATAYAQWIAPFPAEITGSYEVYVRWSVAPNREESAVYFVFERLGATLPDCTCSKNQTVDGGAWNYCCTATVPAGQYPWVRLGNENTNTNEVVVADGVRFVRTTKDGGDILNGSLTGSDVSNGSLYDADIGDEPGLDWAGKGEINLTSVGDCGNPSWTNLTSVTITAPTSGYILVEAAGIASNTVASGQYSRVAIDDSSTGKAVESYAPIFEKVSDETTNYVNEGRYAIRNVYYESSAGTHTYYLKGCKSEFAGGRILWDDFTAIFFPTKY